MANAIFDFFFILVSSCLFLADIWPRRLTLEVCFDDHVHASSLRGLLFRQDVKHHHFFTLAISCLAGKQGAHSDFEDCASDAQSDV